MSHLQNYGSTDFAEIRRLTQTYILLIVCKFESNDESQ